MVLRVFLSNALKYKAAQPISLLKVQTDGVILLL